MIEVETVALGFAVLTPIYAMMWEMRKDLSEMTQRLKDCKYCKKETS